MRILLPVIIVLFVAACAGKSERDTASDAYDRGDYEHAVAMLRPLAEAGDGYSLHRLGVLYLDGMGVAVDYGKAFDYFTRAVAAGTQVSHDALAEMYSRGLGRPVNWKRAVHHWKAAASAGSEVADWELGDYFSDPDLGGQDPAQAEYHYLRSARSGSFFGLYKLGSFYRDRAGKPREALKWWSHAIRKGLFNMAYEIGRLYHDRLLPAEDAEVTALAWYTVAVEHDTDHAKPKVAAMRNRLGSDRVREAARQATAIRAEFGLQSPPRAAP